MLRKIRVMDSRLRGGETKRSFGGVGFFGFNKQSSGHDIRRSRK
ncbi:hypothetical protein [Nostoc sp.]